MPKGRSPKYGTRRFYIWWLEGTFSLRSSKIPGGVTMHELEQMSDEMLKGCYWSLCQSDRLSTNFKQKLDAIRSRSAAPSPFPDGKSAAVGSI